MSALVIVPSAISALIIVPFRILSVVTASGANLGFVTLPFANSVESIEDGGNVPKSSKRAIVPLAEGIFKETAAVPFKVTSLTPVKVRNLPGLVVLSNFFTASEAFGFKTKYLRTPLDVKYRLPAESNSKAPFKGDEINGAGLNLIKGNATVSLPGAMSRVACGVSSLIPILLLEVITITGTEGSWLEVKAIIFPFSKINGNSESIELLVPEPVPPFELPPSTEL